ncbi:MAG: tRNA (adenosine(37)-N6)-threonylcarbamoyltransferase complex dimerization subunit type 1 TsaB [Selenomonadaceae bacterium]|nr:tRNA (adenosine(37)-N6)-threonylcarbamoyltransferase complex dimerization subunit type 1 TsaB [Selenomonadaceae bacterium]
MLVLALETSSKVSSVAVAEENRLLAEITSESKLTHSKTLVAHIEKVLALANKDKKELDAVAVSLGPGSFTGLRIGLAAAKAIAYALNIKIYGAPTLQSLAYHFTVPNLRIVSLMDAQKGMVYREHYKFNEGKLQIIEPLSVVSVEEARREVLSKDEDTVLLGEKAEKVYEGIDTGKIFLAPFYERMPRGALIARYAFQHFENKDNLMALEPLYVRRSEAEDLWEKRHG